MKRLLLILTSLCFLLYCASSQGAPYLSMSLPHYARFFEFYYQNPREQALETTLSGLAREGVLSQSNARLFIAAFLAELLRNSKIDEKKVISLCKTLGSPGVQLAVWTLHLGNAKKYTSKIQNLLKNNPALLSQIKRSPSMLEKYNPANEKTILMMYWAAFMASGKKKWLNDIVKLALEWHDSQIQGLPGAVTGAEAAASLYEFAQKHELVRKVLEEYQSRANPEESEFIQTILGERRN